MQYRLVGGGSVAVLLSLVAGGARGQSVTEALSPRSVGMGESLRAAATGALAPLLNPAGVALTKSYVFEGFYGFRPEDKSHVEAVSLCDSVTTNVAACLSYDHLSASPEYALGTGDRSSHRFALTTAMPISDAIFFGITQKYVIYSAKMMLDPVVEVEKKGYLVDAGLTIKLTDTFNLGIAGYNLIGADDDEYSRALGGGLAWNILPNFMVAFDTRYNFVTDTTRFGGGMEFFWNSSDDVGVPLRFGYVHDTNGNVSALTGGLGFVSSRVGIDLSLRKAVANGDELMMQASLRLFFPN
jgi:hypothetical protein